MSQTNPKSAVENMSSSPDNEGHAGIRTHLTAIAWSWFVVTVPISALTAAFLVMVFHYRVAHNDVPFENLDLKTANEKNVFYVNLTSSVILFVTSWASSLAPMLSGFILTLASFPIARRLFRDVQAGSFSNLPTPYQLALTLQFFDGSALGGIWSWMVYLFSWRKMREPQTPPLIAASSVALIATFLG